jgi:hypothetical protein
VDGDGVPDLVVGAPFVLREGASTGAAWLVPGWWLLDQVRVPLTDGVPRPEDAAMGDLLPARSGLALLGDDAAGLFGQSVALLPDPERAGRAVVAVGLPLGDVGGGLFSGGVAVYRFDDALAGFDPVPIALVGAEGVGQGALGRYVSAGQAADGTLLLVGAPDSDVGGPDLGAGYAFGWAW